MNAQISSDLFNKIRSKFSNITIGDSEQGDPSSAEANWKEVTLESREYFLMKNGQGAMDRWPDHR